MRGRTRQITYCAAATAIAVCAMIIAQLVPLKTPLLLCSLCFYIALDKGGMVLGIISTISAIALILLMGFYGTALLTAIVFAPYAIVAFLTKKVDYSQPPKIAIRVAISIVFANIALASCYLLANIVLPKVDFAGAISYLGGYAVLALAVSVFFIITDFLFFRLCQTITKIIR